MMDSCNDELLLSEGLIDFSKLKDQCITVLSTIEHNKLAESQRQDIRNVPDELELFRSLDQIESTSSTANRMSEGIEQTLNDFERNFRPESSVKQERCHVSRFQNFLENHRKSFDLKTMGKEELNLNLRLFYKQLMKQDGEHTHQHRYCVYVQQFIGI